MRKRQVINIITIFRIVLGFQRRYKGTKKIHRKKIMKIITIINIINMTKMRNIYWQVIAV